MSWDAELLEYLAQVMPAALIGCAGCGAERVRARGVIRSDQFFCSETCADRNLAVLIKAQPKGVEIDGWQV